MLLFIVLTVISFFCVHKPSIAAAQDPRFVSVNRCLRASDYDKLDCVTCDTRITIDPSQGVDCRPLVEQGRSLHNMVCGELDDAVQSIAMEQTVHLPDGCIEVLIQQRSESYVLRSDPDRVIRQNVVFRRDTLRTKRQAGTSPPPTQVPEQAIVSFADDDQMPMETDNVPYVLQFRNSDLLGMTGILFQDSSGRIGIEDIEVVVIEKCGFQYFSQGSVDVYNCPTVFVSETEFLHNGPVSTQLLQEYRGDSAGLSVAINKMPSDTSPPLQFYIYDCTFRNNSAGVDPVATETNDTSDSTPPTDEGLATNPPDTGGDDNNSGGSDDGGNNGGTSGGGKKSRPEMFQAVGGVVVGLQFVSRGGGLALIVNDGNPADVVVRGCVFRSNVAFAFGGGMYVGLDGRSQHSVVINQSRFDNNTSPSTGGGLQISFLKEGVTGSDNRVVLTDTVFINNYAEYGGGVFFLPIDIDPNTVDGDAEIGVFVQFERCSFIGNSAEDVGGAFGGAFRILAFNTKPLLFIDCMFENNSVGGVGIVSTAFYPLTFHGNNTFINSRGASLAVIGSRVVVYGNLLFKDNSHGGSLDRGSLYVTSQGQIQLTPGASISFVNNSGITGAALYVEAPHVPVLFSKLRFNPLCVLLFQDTRISPDFWHRQNLSLQFTDNEAVVSSAVYINNLDLCSWNSEAAPFFDREKVFHWEFVNFTENVNRAHRSNRTDPQLAVQTPPVRVDIMQDEIFAFPGQRINLRLSGFDELDTATTVVSRISDNTKGGAGELFKFAPGAISLDTVNVTSRVSYLLPRDDSEIEERERREIRAVSLLKPNRRIMAEDSFDVLYRRCPAGLKMANITDSSQVCICDEERQDIVTCNGRLITLNTQLWGVVNLQQVSDRDLDPLSTYPCPYGYCSCVVQSSSGQLECTFVFDSFAPNDQCNCNREGVLCGNCIDGMGFTVLSNQCVTCDSLFGLLVIALIAVDIAVIIFLLVVMKPVPLWVYPALYHLQILPHFTEHFPVTFELIRPYLFYVASATGLYFPYDFCLHDRLDAFGAYSLRYLPPVLAVVVTVIVLIMRYKICRPCSWHGVWWIVLLLYTPTLHTSMSVLNCPMVPVANETLSSRWYVNGNIKCFNGAHIPIGLLAICVLGCCVALIPLSVLVSLKKLSFPRWLRHLEEPLTDAYKEKYKWWSGVELAKRVILVLFAVAFPGNTYAVILTLMALIAISSYCKPYKQRIINVLDLVLGSDVLILLMLRNTAFLEDVYQVITSEVAIGARNSECGSTFTGITSFVAILTPFYYIPLALFVGCLVAWLMYHTYRLCRCYIVPRIKYTTKNDRERRVLSIKSNTEESRPRTRTVIDMNELEAEQDTPRTDHIEMVQFSKFRPQDSKSNLLSSIEQTDLEETSNIQTKTNEQKSVLASV